MSLKKKDQKLLKKKKNDQTHRSLPKAFAGFDMRRHTHLQIGCRGGLTNGLAVC